MAFLTSTGKENCEIGTTRSTGLRDPIGRWADPRSEPAFIRSLFWGKANDWTFVRAKGEPEKAIVEIAREHDAELIVVGAGQPSRLKRLLGQTVSESVVARAHCDVYVVR